MVRHLASGMMLLLLLTSMAWAEEIVYVHDELRLGVRPSADSSSAPLEVVTTGARLEVLGRSGSFVRVRTSRGVEGWVNAAYLSEEKPARLLLEELQEENALLQQQIADQQTQLAQAEVRLLTLGQRLEQTEEMEGQLQQQIADYRAELQQEMHSLAWLAQPLLGIGLFLFGIYLGVKWYRHRISERMGGLEI